MNRSNVHRGLTLIEILVALGLLTMVLMGMTAWLSLSGRALAATTVRTSFADGCRTMTRRIVEDLAVGDFDPAAKTERVIVEDGILRIRTRTASVGSFAGPVEHAYRFDPIDRTLIVTEMSMSASDFERVLLRQVGEVSFEIESVGPIEPRILRIEVVSPTDVRFEWEWILR